MIFIGGVIVIILALSAVDHMFELRSGHNKGCKIGSCCFSAKHATLRRKSRLVGSESGKRVRVWRHVYPRTVVSVC